MAKKDLMLKGVKKHLLGLKALIGFNAVINLYIEESEIMMMVAFHKIEQYKHLPPLTIQFVESDYKDDQVQINTAIADQVKVYCEGRLNITDKNDVRQHRVIPKGSAQKNSPRKPNHAVKTIRVVGTDGEIE